MKIRTVETLHPGDMIAATLFVGDTDAEATLAGALHMPADLYLRFLGRLDNWPYDRVDRGRCTGCGHGTHTADECGAAMVTEPEGDTHHCRCGTVEVDVPTHPETPAEAHAADARADAGAGRL